MPKKLGRDSTRICVTIWADTDAALRKMTSREMNYNEIVRAALDSFVRQAEARARAKIDALATAPRVALEPATEGDW